MTSKHGKAHTALEARQSASNTPIQSSRTPRGSRILDLSQLSSCKTPFSNLPLESRALAQGHPRSTLEVERMYTARRQCAMLALEQHHLNAAPLPATVGITIAELIGSKMMMTTTSI